MTWAELIREYYKKCLEVGCPIDLWIDCSEFGAQYIIARAHRGKLINKKIIGYIGGSGMKCYDNYADPDEVVDQTIKEMVWEIDNEVNCD